MTRVSVIVPTFRRPASLRRAVESLFAQTHADFELVVVDNDPAGSALASCAEFAARAPMPFQFSHAPDPGVSHARNAALQLATGALIAFLDDDESAPPHWLAALLAAQSRFEADVVWGPVRARLEAPDIAHARYFENLYNRAGPVTSQPITRFHGAGNSLIVRDRLLAGLAPFDTRANETGGEDDRLFAQAQARGACFAWAPDAWVTEHVQPARAQLNYALRRAFAYGQAPCETAAAQGRPFDIARHMAIGAAQAVTYGLASGAACLARPPSALPLLDRAARGAGKVLWFAPQRFYGAAAL